MLDFIELGVLIESLPKLSPCTPTVSDNRLDTKYWIEQYEGNHAHGNPWFVFTTTDSEEDYGDGPDKIIISIPYHAEASAYHYGECDDLMDFPEAWDDWLSYTKPHRQSYVREFRNKQSHKIADLKRENKQLNDAQALNTMSMFDQLIAVSCIPKVAKKAPATIHDEQETKTMNEFYHERTHLENDLRTSYRTHEQKLDEKHHINGITPKSMAHVVELIKAGHFEGADDEKRMKKEYNHHNPLYEFTFREHAADHKGREADGEKLAEAFRTAKLKVNTLLPAESLKAVESFRTLY